MKKKRHYLIAIIVVIIITASGCKKTTQEQLPPETHVGAFTFGCKVDGKIYTAIGKLPGFGGLNLNPQYVHFSLMPLDLLDISAQNYLTDLRIRFEFIFQYKDSLGTYFLKTGDGFFYDGKTSYRTTNIHSGSVTIKYFNGSFNPPTFATVVAGTFEMDAVNGEGKVVHITEGRFDIGQ